MSYSIAHDENVDAAIRRIADEQIARAREQLTDHKLPREKRVHEARKRFKETRALLRLVREPLGDHFAEENASFRDAGRELATARDADAVLEALEQLELPRAIRNRVRRRLHARKSADAPLAELIQRTLQQLTVAQTRIAQWPSMDDSFATLVPGLMRTYREGRRAMRRAKSAEELHEWRKHVKTHWYHVLLLRESWPGMAKALASELHDLSDALGHHHDLDVLRGLAGDVPELVTAIDDRQRTMEHEAHELGARIFAEKPNAWLARMRNVWKAWKER